MIAGAGAYSMKRTCFSKHVILSLIIFFLAFQILAASGSPALLVPYGETAISGYVYDAKTGLPIRNATIMIFRVSRWALITKLQTAPSGFFIFKVTKEVGYQAYRVYAYMDAELSAGVDYVPALWDVTVREGVTASYVFNLIPAASIIMDGEIRFVESTKPVSDYGFRVLSPDGALTDPYIWAYGTGDAVNVLGLNRSHVVVPAETRAAVKLWANVPVTGTRETRYYEFTIGEDIGYFRLSQGGLLKVDVGVYCIQFGVTKVKSIIDSALALLIKAEDTGFLVTAEREDLSNALTLLTASTTSIRSSLFDDAFAHLRQAYISVSEAASKLQGLFEAGSRSALVSTVFLAFTSITIIYLMTEGGLNAELFSKEKHLTTFSLRPFILLGVYALILTIFFLAFPGCRLIPLQNYVLTASIALLTSYIIIGLPGRYPEKTVEHGSIAFISAVVASFTIALRNLRRRKLRTALTVTTVIILVFGFITTTSVSMGRGLVTQAMGKASVPIEVLLIEEPDTQIIDSFLPLPETFITWLESKPNVTLVAPKAENTPRLLAEAIGSLSSPSMSIGISGILGIEPSREAWVTLINKTVVEGAYLQDGEDDGILLSASLVKTLEVKVGDEVHFLNQRFRVVGFYGDEALEGLRDVHGNPIMPRYLQPQPGGPPIAVPLRGNQIVVMTFNRAMTFPDVVISRVSIQMSTPENIQNFAQIIASTFEYSAWVSIGGKLQLQFVGGYLEEKGMTMTPLLMGIVTLIVGTTVYAAVEERRNELAILSSIGLNPTHITVIFLAEAAIIGFIGGGLGYLMGTVGYRVMGFTIGPLTVREKVSADWGLFAMLFSITATLLGALIPALKASTVVTPSLQRKWKLEGQDQSLGSEKGLDMELPVKIRPREVDLFLDYMAMRFSDTSQCRDVEDLKGEEGDEVAFLRKLRFTFLHSSGDSAVKGEVVVSRRPEEKYLNARLVTTAELLRGGVTRSTRCIHEAASFVRKLVFEWNTLTFKVASFIEPLNQVYTLIKYYTPKVVHLVTTEKDVTEKLVVLEDTLAKEGMRIPTVLISHINPLDMDDCLRKAEVIVRESNVVCITGDSAAPCTALAITALEQKRMMCYITDLRSPEEQAAHPFKMLNVMSVHPRTEAWHIPEKPSQSSSTPS